MQYLGEIKDTGKKSLPYSPRLLHPARIIDNMFFPLFLDGSKRVVQFGGALIRAEIPKVCCYTVVTLGFMSPTRSRPIRIENRKYGSTEFEYASLLLPNVLGHPTLLNI